MGNLILHCGAKPATFAEIAAIPVPHTRTHRPIPYGDAVEFLVNSMRAHYGMEPKSTAFGLQRDGAQLFAQINYDVGDSGRVLSLGLRNSYDMSLRCKFGGGASVMVCDNLCFHASGFVVMRKNTTYAWSDFQTLVGQHVPRLMDQYQATVAECARLESVPCGLDRGYAMLGVALGRKLLTSTQAAVAYGDWREPRHEEFAERNLWSLYNCATEGLKKGAIGNAIERHTNVHDYFMQQADKPAPAARIIDATAN